MVARAQRASVEDLTDATECARRQSIIAAANDLLDEVGLDGLTIRAILKRTGLARRAFYERFDGKDDLVLAVFAETLREAAVHFTHEVAPLPNPLDQLRIIVFGLVHGSQPEEGTGIGPRRVSAIVREHMRLAQTRPVELESALRPLLAVIAERISAGIRTGQVRNCDPALQATLIYNLIASTVHIELLMEESGGPASHRREMLGNEIWEFCRGAIAARNS
jgi:AcrR family transcriptional regulator